MLKRMIGALAVAALMLPAAVGAQQNATITLRSGEKVTGQLVDLGGVGFTMKVNGADRRIPVSQVSVVDFGGGDLSDSDWAKFTSGSNAVFLKNGETVNGQLHDISGRTPLKILLKTDSGNREFSADEVGRIVLARPDSAVAATTGSTAGIPEGDGVAVIANQQWTSTGITVRRGDVMTFDASGEAKLNTAGEIARPSGTGGDRKVQGALSQVPPAVSGAQRRSLRGQLGRLPGQGPAPEPRPITQAWRYIEAGVLRGAGLFFCRPRVQ
jgi:hypothetical protein